MPKRSASQHVPKEMQARFEEITQLTDAFCHKYLNEEYRQLCRELTATLGRKRPSPLVRGKAPVWACGIIHALGMVNFLFDSSQTPHIAASQIWEYFALSSSTMQAKSKQIRDLLGMYPLDPAWSTPSMLDQNPLVWMLEVNGLIIDVRHAPKPTGCATSCPAQRKRLGRALDDMCVSLMKRHFNNVASNHSRREDVVKWTDGLRPRDPVRGR